MTATLTAPDAAPVRPLRRRPASPVVRGRPGWPVWAAAALVVLLRLPFVAAAPGPDEGGYLAVAAQWRPGPSLYGAYWVDRPPLLLMLFQVADHAGGVVALRLLGCVAAGTAVLLVGLTGQWLAGRRAAAVGALVAAVLLSSPLAGATAVNGELLAAPFTAGGIALAVAALRPRAPGRRAGLAAALGAGGCAAAALLVKQNLADAAVFAAVAWLVAWRLRQVSGRRLGLLVAAAGSGAVLCGLLVAAWTTAHGTSLVGVWDAMYPFRLRASHVSAVLVSPALQQRLDLLGQLWLWSGIPLLVLALAWAVAGPRRRDPAAWGLLVAIGFGVLSILAGGSYNSSHYLVELVVPVAVGTALVVPVRPRTTAALVSLVAVVAATAWGHALVTRTVTPGAVVGRSIGRVAHAGDSVVSVLGNANTVRTAGLRSPYPYLWSLPARTLDPHGTLLRGVLAGSHAPTWLVAAGHGGDARMRHGTLGPAVRADYHRVARECGRTVYLHDGLQRAPFGSRRCAGPSALTQVRQEWRVLAHPDYPRNAEPAARSTR